VDEQLDVGVDVEFATVTVTLAAVPVLPAAS
jgi:hypothetical protein